MKIHPDKKKEHLVFFLTGIGVLVVLAIWGLQLSEMISTVNAKADSEVDSTLHDFSEAHNLADRMKSSIPFLQNSFDDITSQWWTNKTAEATNETLDSIGDELSDQLDGWLAEQAALEAVAQGEEMETQIQE